MVSYVRSKLELGKRCNFLQNELFLPPGELLFLTNILHHFCLRTTWERLDLTFRGLEKYLNAVGNCAKLIFGYEPPGSNWFYLDEFLPNSALNIGGVTNILRYFACEPPGGGWIWLFEIAEKYLNAGAVCEKPFFSCEPPGSDGLYLDDILPHFALNLGGITRGLRYV